jgi:NMD protein affecting ribosome stability and mRNA decay
VTVAEINARYASTPRSCPGCAHTTGTTIDGVCPPCYRKANNIVEATTRRGSTR